MGAGAKPGERRGGRQAGVPNKKTRSLLERMEALNFDPIDFAIQLINGKTGLKSSEKVTACLKLAEFIYPKRKSIEVNDKPEESLVDKVYRTEWGNRREVSDAKEE